MQNSYFLILDERILNVIVANRSPEEDALKINFIFFI